MEDILQQQYMRASEAAEYLGYTTQHTRFLVREGSLPGRKFGRDWLIERQAVLDFTDESKLSSTARILTTDNVPPLPFPAITELRAVNVAQVPKRSPFRYPGGKTWLIPCIRQWLRAQPGAVRELIEPFAGGGIISLTAIFEGLADHATLIELDEDVASVWLAILNGYGDWLADAIAEFKPTLANIQALFAQQDTSLELRALTTMVRNRVARGGILAPGAGMVKYGENGKGLSSRWYPETLRRRILEIVELRERLTFIEGDGLKSLREYADRPGCVWFIDPPYTLAGKRLYRYSDIDHEELFALASKVVGDVLITYDNAPEIRYLAAKHQFEARLISMKTTHHRAKSELIIGKSLGWLPTSLTG